MDKFEYTCEYCGKKYIPKRRKVQRFCSNSCRTRKWQQQRCNKIATTSQQENTDILTPEVEVLHPIAIQEKKEKVTMAGVSNAAIGVAAVDFLTNTLTKPENKPAKQGSVDELKSIILGQRYFLIKNIPIQHNGKKAHFDIEKSELVYF